MELAGKSAVVVGAASGIGRGTALELARRGCDVVVADVNEKRAAEVVAEVEALGRRAVAVRCDVTSDEDVDSLLVRSLDAYEQVDVLMNSAGVSLLGAVENIGIEDWQWCLDVNLMGVIRTCKAFLPHFIEQRAGHIVNVASVAGLYAYSYDAVPYVTSKFGCVGYSEGLAVYLKRRGIGVSVLCPGLVTTNLGENARVLGVDDPMGFMHLHAHMQRAIEPAEVGTRVADAIEAERYLILTHDEDADLLAKRRADMDAAIAAQSEEMPDPFAGR
jgi:NAD(P)-dependent dehydrogenase (short-subunit alcohol dehydrogenase family)